MTKSGTISLSDIARIQIYVGKKRNTKSGMKAILQETGGDIVLNGPYFLWESLTPCCHLKADGNVLYTPGYSVWGISWNRPEDIGMKVLPNADANYVECTQLIKDGKSILKPEHLNDKAKKYCTAIGVKDGRFAYYASKTKTTYKELLDLLLASGWDGAIRLDGGGSTSIYFKDGSGFAGDGRYVPIWIVIHLKQEEYEPKGEKPNMTDDIRAYSLKKDGGNDLTEHFKVKEFACKDGTDTIFISQKLVLLCECLRVRINKPLVVNSAYRTEAYNKKVGGAEFSQHLYGTAVDLKTPAGWTPEKMAAIARKNMTDWGGVGIYDWGIHVDVRKKKADWHG